MPIEQKIIYISSYWWINGKKVIQKLQDQNWVYKECISLPAGRTFQFFLGS